jgi:signal transduction histidine kinase
MPVAGLGPNHSSTSPWRHLGRAAETAARDLVYLTAAFCMSIIGFVVWVTGLSVTVSLLVLVVGVLVWLVTVYAFRFTTLADRRLAGWLRREPIPGVYRKPANRGLLALLREVTVDPQTWKDLGWLVLNSIVGFAASLAALTATLLVLGYVTMPLWWWAISDPHTQYGTLNLGLYTVTSTGWAFVTTALGLLLAPVALLLNRCVASAHAAVAARILGPSEAQRLDARVKELASTRAGAVEAASEQLERIERDLHDGAQARLVALGMSLGMAEQKLAEDPERVGELLAEARMGAEQALRELRDLARGIHPPVLADRGLEAAIQSLANSTPMKVTLAVDLEQRPAPAVESAAYFVVAEALANAAKHARARRLDITIARTDDLVDLQVEDDGIGGANPEGSGLRGLRRRVEALDGTLSVVSPRGGPTRIRAQLPCAL